MNETTLVIAYGNPLRSDDGVGWEVARRLEAAHDTALTVITIQQLTPELAQAVAHAGRVIFVDAAEGDVPGAWKCEQVLPLEDRVASLGHYFAPVGLLAYARAVFGSCPEAWVISIAAKSFACGEGLSAEVEAALPAVVDHILRLRTEDDPSAGKKPPALAK